MLKCLYLLAISSFYVKEYFQTYLIDEGLSFTEITKDYYPELREHDIHACLRYAIALVAKEDIALAAVMA